MFIMSHTLIYENTKIEKLIHYSLNIKITSGQAPPIPGKRLP